MIQKIIFSILLILSFGLWCLLMYLNRRKLTTLTLLLYILGYLVFLCVFIGTYDFFFNIF